MEFRALVSPTRQRGINHIPRWRVGLTTATATRASNEVNSASGPIFDLTYSQFRIYSLRASASLPMKEAHAGPAATLQGRHLPGPGPPHPHRPRRVAAL